jgi:hypothetical protein
LTDQVFKLFFLNLIRQFMMRGLSQDQTDLIVVLVFFRLIVLALLFRRFWEDRGVLWHLA